jgi:F0F1-type ATP synthase membrane subunit b/b'
MVFFGAGLAGALIGGLAVWCVCREFRRRAERSATEIGESAHRKAELIAQETRVRVEIETDRRRAELETEIARDLRQKIEDELQYPSMIKVTVIREQRFVETAR